MPNFGETGSRYAVWLLGKGIEVVATRVGAPNVTDGGGCPDAAAGVVEVTAPRVNDKRLDPDTGERQRFSSKILPAWARKSPQMSEVLPLLYLHGLSTSDFGAALEQFLGSGAGLSATTITRLTAQ
jgi:hypothetical protein